MKYFIPILFLFACQENVAPTPPDSAPKAQQALKSARLLDDCEATTYNNGLVADECEIGMGGTLIRDTYIDTDGHTWRMMDVAGGGGVIVDHYEATLQTNDNVNDIHSTVSTSVSGVYPMVVLDVSNFNGTPYDYSVVLQYDGIHLMSNSYDVLAITDSNVILPQLKNYTLKGSLPSKSLYDSAGFVKRKK